MKEEPMCPVCEAGLELRFPAVADPQTGETFRILRCDLCGIGVTIPRPDDLSCYYADYYGSRHGFTRRFRDRQRAALVIEFAASGRLLDIGCGDGSFIKAMSDRGFETAGTELVGSRGDAKNVFPDLESVRSFYGDRSFDVITMWHSLEHLRDPSTALEFVRRLLRPDGVLLIAVPDSGSLQAVATGRKWLHLDVPRHLFHFDRRSLHQLLKKRGFDVQSTRHLEVEYDILGWSQSALNLVFREPNVFLRTLTGHRARVGGVVAASNFVLGAIFSALSLPLVAIGAVMGRGASLIVAARPKKMHD